jgi:hypothetical protein
MKLLLTKYLFIALSLTFVAAATGFGQDHTSAWLPYQKENKKWCFVSVNDGAVLNNTEYDSVVPFYDMEVAKVLQKGKWGVVDAMGNIIVPTEYKTIEYSGKHVPAVFVVEKEGVPLKGMCTLKGEFINPFKYYDVAFNYGYDSYFLPYTPVDFYMGYYQCFTDESKRNYEVVNEKGQVVLDESTIKNTYTTDQHLHYYINQSGIVAIFDYNDTIGTAPRNRLIPNWMTLGKSPNGKTYSAINMRKGVIIIDNDGNIVNETEFFSRVDRSFYLVDEKQDSTMYFIIQKGNREGVIDETGKYVIESEYSTIGYFENTIPAHKDGINYRFNRNFVRSYSPSWFDSDEFGVSFSQFADTITKARKKGINTLSGKTLIAPKWNYVDATHFGGDFNFICYSQPGEETNRFHFSKRMKIYDQSGKVLVKKRNVRVKQLGYNLVFLEYKSKIEIIRADGTSIVKSAKPVHELKEINSIEDYDYVRIDTKSTYPDYKHSWFYNFHSSDGWMVLDSAGNIVFRSHLTGYNYANAFVNADLKVVGISCMQITESSDSSAAETIYGPITVPMKNHWYVPEENKIYDQIGDSVIVVSLSNQVLKKMKLKKSKYLEDYSIIAYYPKMEDTGLDSIYSIGDTIFTDFNFNPLKHAAITGYSLTDSNIIGTNGENKFLMLKNNEWVTNPRMYDKIQDFRTASFVCFNKDLVDIYSPEGNLLFENCTNLKQYFGFRSFTCNGKTVWTNDYGIIYEPKIN